MPPQPDPLQRLRRLVEGARRTNHAFRVPHPREPEVTATVRTVDVLIVATDEDIRYLLERRFSASDLGQIVSVATTFAALATAARLHPTVIVVHIQHGADHEFELIERLKQCARHAVVVAYANILGSEAWSRAVHAGAERYAVAGKPLTELVAQVRTALGNPQPSNRHVE